MMGVAEAVTDHRKLGEGIIEYRELENRLGNENEGEISPRYMQEGSLLLLGGFTRNA
jgi:hypothetical protein